MALGLLQLPTPTELPCRVGKFPSALTRRFYTTLPPIPSSWPFLGPRLLVGYRGKFGPTAGRRFRRVGPCAMVRWSAGPPIPMPLRPSAVRGGRAMVLRLLGCRICVGALRLGLMPWAAALRAGLHRFRLAARLAQRLRLRAEARHCKHTRMC